MYKRLCLWNDYRRMGYTLGRLIPTNEIYATTRVLRSRGCVVIPLPRGWRYIASWPTWINEL